MSELSALGRAALDYAAQGLAVFPLHPRSKLPLFSKDNGGNGFLDASTDPETVTAWWTAHPSANIGAVPASVGCIALDVDKPEHDAAATALGLFSEPTHTVSTGNGRHVWFRYDAPDLTILAGIIVRSGRGYVLMPPSVHPSGAVYAAETTIADAAPLPPAALAALTTPAPTHPPAPITGGIIAEGGRHIALCQLAGKLAGRIPEDFAAAALHGINEAQCRPPLDADEVQRIARDIYARDRREHPARHAERADYSALVSEDAPRFTVRSLRALFDDPTLNEPERFVIPGLVAEGCVTLLSGAPKAGKSTLASQLAADLSAGRASVNGEPMPPGVVLWLALDEPLKRLVQRMPYLDANPDRFHVFARELATLTPERFAALVDQVDPALVVIDTLSQLASDNAIKKNDGDEVAPFMKDLVSVIHARPRCGGLFLWHAPHHAPRAAGSMQWEATVDAPLVLRRRFEAAPRPGESPDDDEHSEDGRRVLVGMTRWGGELKMALQFSEGRYGQGATPAPLIQKVRWALQGAEAGPEVTSRAAITKAVRARAADVADVIRQLIARGEAREVGNGRKSYIEPTASMKLYAGSEAEGMGSVGESYREEKAPREIASLPGIVPASECGKRKEAA